MIKKIGFKFSVNAMLVLLTLVLGYHLLILTGVISYEVAWGGRLKSQSEMYVFETISIGINSIIMLIISIKGGYVQSKISFRFINTLLWIIAIIFVLNTVGNIFSTNALETIIFTPLTFLSAILCYRIAVEK